MKRVKTYSPKQIEQIQEFIENTFGTASLIGHEIKSRYVHTDVAISDAGDGTVNFATFGMGAKKMKAPIPQLRRAELVMCSTGKVEPQSYESAVIISELQRLSKFPFANHTFLGPYHTIGASEIFQQTFGFQAFMLADAHVAAIDKIGCVRYLWVIPIYQEERELAMESGSRDVLEELVEEFGTEIHFVDSGRGSMRP